MKISIQEVRTKEQLRKFIFFPEQLHANDPRWVPPVYMDEWKFYQPRYNRSLEECDVVLYLAYEGERLCGRIMGIISKPYNQIHNERTGRFFNLECVNEQEVAHALLTSVEEWAGKKGMNRLIGPFGFSDKDPEGIQIEGFEHLPVIATACNFPYLKELVERENYIKKTDCLVYKLDVPGEIPDVYLKVYQRLIKNPEYRIIEFTKRSQLKPFIIPVLKLVNETYKSIFGFMPMDSREMKELAGKYLPILNPEFTKIVVNKNGVPLAFVIASPDMSKGIQKARGRLFPFGFIHILSSARKSKQLDLFLGAVKDPETNKGLTALLGVRLFLTAQKHGMEYIDSHLILETNQAMRKVMERLGATAYKRYRIYTKPIKDS